MYNFHLWRERQGQCIYSSCRLPVTSKTGQGAVGLARRSAWHSVCPACPLLANEEPTWGRVSVRQCPWGAVLEFKGGSPVCTDSATEQNRDRFKAPGPGHGQWVRGGAWPGGESLSDSSLHAREMTIQPPKHDLYLDLWHGFLVLE